MKRRVTIKKSGGGFDINIGGRGVAFAKKKNEAVRKAKEIRRLRDKGRIR